MLQPKKNRLAEWIQKQDPYICCLQETHFRRRETYRLKVRGWKKIFHANGNQKKAGVTILISDKIDFKIKTIVRDKEGHYIMIKGSIQEDITITNVYAPNVRAPQYIRQMLTTMKAEMNSNTIIVGDFSTPLTAMDRSSKQKILKATKEKQQITYTGIPSRLLADFSTETLQARRKWHDIFKVMKGKNLKPRICYPTRVSLKFDGEFSRESYVVICVLHRNLEATLQI